ncbi:MAG: hypothetical protein M1814_005461 [Vezdaea aestivalis]|nr:MAG: hypothetical protein M1814_005461 [Vezdaea aestivalis]
MSVQLECSITIFGQGYEGMCRITEGGLKTTTYASCGSSGRAVFQALTELMQFASKEQAHGEVETRGIKQFRQAVDFCAILRTGRGTSRGRLGREPLTPLTPLCRAGGAAFNLPAAFPQHNAQESPVHPMVISGAFLPFYCAMDCPILETQAIRSVSAAGFRPIRRCTATSTVFVHTQQGRVLSVRIRRKEIDY